MHMRLRVYLYTLEIGEMGLRLKLWEGMGILFEKNENETRMGIAFLE